MEAQGAKTSSEYLQKLYGYLNKAGWKGGTGIPVKFCDTIVSHIIVVFLRASPSCQNQQQRLDILSLHSKRQRRRLNQIILAHTVTKESLHEWRSPCGQRGQHFIKAVILSQARNLLRTDSFLWEKSSTASRFDASDS